MNKICKEEIEKRVKKKFGDDFIVEEVNGMGKTARFKHIKCGKEWFQTPENFLKGVGCIDCNKAPQYNKISYEEFKNKMYEKYENQYTLLEYTSLRKPFKVIHNYFYTSSGKKKYCGHEDIITDGINFLKRHGRRTFCKYCNKSKEFKNIDVEFKNSVKFCVYIHLNKYNKKIYIGITSQTFKERWNNGNGYCKNIYFFNAINKYKWKSFQHFVFINGNWEEVDENIDLKKYYNFNLQTALDYEKKLIEKCRKKYGINNIYNISSGGAGITGVREKPVLQFDLDGEFVEQFMSCKLASINTKISYGGILLCCNHKSKSSGGFLWKFASDPEELVIPNKVSQKNVGVIQYDINGIYINYFSSVRVASKILKISQSAIISCCKGRTKTAAGYQWKYINSNKIIEPIVKHKHHIRKVYQYDLKGNFIQCYNSMTEAEKASKAMGIWNSCNNKQAQSGGFIWLYDPSDLPLHLKMLLNKRNPNQLHVYKYDMQGRFLEKYNSIKECAKKNGVDRNGISDCCKGRVVAYKGFIYLYEEKNYKEKLNERLNMINSGCLKNKNCKKVAKIDEKTNEVINIYDSVKEAVKVNFLKSSSSISACCRGKTKTSGGFIWKYIDD